MEIPAFFATYRDDKMQVTDGHFTATTAKEGSRYLDFRETVSEGIDRSARAPAVFVDCNSFAEREFSEKVMKHMNVKGADVWFMTYIETVEDVFDSFNRDAEIVLAPYHFILNEAELKDICSVSDSVVPVLFVHNGRLVQRGRRHGDVLGTLEKLVSIGYYRNCILDMGNSLNGYTWSIISSDFPSTIPFVDSPYHAEGFQNTIVPFLI